MTKDHHCYSIFLYSVAAVTLMENGVHHVDAEFLSRRRGKEARNWLTLKVFRSPGAQMDSCKIIQEKHI